MGWTIYWLEPWCSVMMQDRVSFVGLSLENVAVSDHVPIETVAG